MARLTRIYTRGGDEGSTSLGSGERVPKDGPRVQAYGAVDELNSCIGVARAHGVSERLAGELARVQNELFDLGSDLCFPEEDREEHDIPRIEARHVERLEGLLDELTAELGPLEDFILPGGTPAAAWLHLARAVCRRAERDVVALARQESVGEHVLPYLNRLSDALFVMARHENREGGDEETLWQPRSP